MIQLKSCHKLILWWDCFVNCCFQGVFPLKWKRLLWFYVGFWGFVGWRFVTKLAVFSFDFVAASSLPRSKIFRLLRMIHLSWLAHWTCQRQTQSAHHERGGKKKHQIPKHCQCFWTSSSPSRSKSRHDLQRHLSPPGCTWGWMSNSDTLGVCMVIVFFKYQWKILHRH